MNYLSNISIASIINRIYCKTNKIVYVNIRAGLGNRLMSFAGIIILSIYFKAKPISILVYNLY